MDWSSGYTATFYACFVDPQTWLDIGRFEITGGSVSRSEDDLRQSASLSCTDYNEMEERWVRIYMDAEQGGDLTHNALFTGMATSPSRSINGAVIEKDLDCYSVLKACDDILLQRGYYVPAGKNAVSAIQDLLKVTPAPIEVEGESPQVLDAIIAEDDETNLTMIDKILKAINWRMKIEGDGTIVLSPVPDVPAVKMSSELYDILETSLDIKRDWFECPNVFRATMNEMSAIARDDDPDSPLSTVSRGREIWAQDEADLADDETLAEYAKRMLKEAQDISEAAKYTRRYLPELNVGDIVRLGYPQISGDFRITSQDIDLTFNGQTSEEVKRG